MAAVTAPSTWAYKGRDAAGKPVRGSIDATSEQVVVSRLRGMGITPVAIKETSGGTGLNRELSFGGLFDKKVGLKDLAVMSRQMSTMITAGLSLLRTLTILAEQSENPTLAKVLDQVRADVESGSSLSEAMAKHDKHFPPLMINMVRAGETGGYLEGALESVAENYEKEVELRATIKSALSYPIVVLCMAVLAVIAMLLFIVPIFKNMFDGLGGTLPVPTLVLVWLSEMMVWIGPVLLIGGVAFTIWWSRNKNTERVRRVVDPLKLKLPVFGLLFKKIAIARFTRNFSTMMRSGVPILTALGVVGATSGNWVIERMSLKVQDAVRQGRALAGPLAEEPVIPPMVAQMVAVGEDSGTLETMLRKISDFYDADVKATTEQLTSLIEPLMIAFIGVIVGGMIVSLYLPMFSMFELVK